MLDYLPMDETETEVTGRGDCPERLVALTAIAVAGRLLQEATFALTFVLGAAAALLSSAFR